MGITMGASRTAVLAAFGLAVVGLGAVGTVPAKVGSYAFTALQYPRGGIILPLGVNVENTVVGVLFSDDVSYGGRTHGIIWSAGRYIKVDAIGARAGGATEFTGINARGIAVGDYVAADGSSHLFTYDLKTGPQTSTIFAAQPKLGFSNAAINDAGVVTGALSNGLGESYAFVGRGTSIRIIGRPAKAKSYYSTAINNHNLAIGVYSLDGYDKTGSFTFKNGVSAAFSVAGSTAAFLNYVGDDGTLAGHTGSPTTLDGGTGFVQTGQSVTTYGYPGADGTSVAGVTSAGNVVGNYESGNFRGMFLYSAGHYSKIDPLASGTQFSAMTVNPGGTFTGTYQKNGGSTPGALVAVCAADQVPCTQ